MGLKIAHAYEGLKKSTTVQFPRILISNAVELPMKIYLGIIRKMSFLIKMFKILKFAHHFVMTGCIGVLPLLMDGLEAELLGEGGGVQHHRHVRLVLDQPTTIIESSRPLISVNAMNKFSTRCPNVSVSNVENPRK